MSHISTNQTLFWEACSSGNVEDVKRLADMLDVCINMHTPKTSKLTGLMRAVIRRHVDVVRFLLTLPSLDLSLQTEDGATALWIAFESANFDISKLLLDDPRSNPNDRCGAFTLLHVACTHGHGKLVEMLIKDKRFVANFSVDAAIARTPPAQEARTHGYNELADLVDAFTDRPWPIHQQLLDRTWTRPTLFQKMNAAFKKNMWILNVFIFGMIVGAILGKIK